MNTTTTLDEVGLRAFAGEVRAAIGHDGPDGWQTGELRNVLTDAADLFERVADGSTDPGLVQGAVDRINAAIVADRERAFDTLDAATDAEDAAAWRDALMHLLPALPLDQVAVLMQAFGRGLADQAADACHLLDSLPAASEVMQ